MNQFIFIVSIFIGLTTFSEFLIAEESMSLSVIENFSKLSLIEQKKLLAEKFQKRMEFAENLFYRSEIRTESYQNNNGVPGERIGDSFTRRQFAHWQLKNDYQYNIEFFEPPKEEPLMWATANWNGQEGECKNIVKNESIIGRVFGRVDTKFDQAVLPNDKYTFWLQGGSSETYPQPHYMFLHFLEHQDEWDIVVPFENNKIQVSVNFIPKSKKSPNLSGKGNISIVIDPEKNYMPVRGNIRGDITASNGNNVWWTVEFIVQQSELINDIWMPVLLKTIASGSIQSHTLPVATIKITEMEQGKVTKDDVTFQFPEGTEVTDAIKGVSYKTDANGELVESTIQPLYGLDPSQVKLPEPPKRKINIVFLVAGVLMIVTALYILVKIHRKSN
jgi:hypothetical protein